MTTRRRLLIVIVILLLPLGGFGTAGAFETLPVPTVSARAQTATEAAPNDMEAVHSVWTFRQRRPASEDAAFGTRSSFSQLVTDGTTTFTLLEDILFGIDAASGELRWRRTLPDRPTADLLVNDGTVFAGITNDILAIDSVSGADRWRVSSPTPYRSGMVRDGTRLFRMNSLGMLIALDTSTGRELWSADVGAAGQLSPAAAGHGRVVITGQPPSGSSLGRIIMLDSATGAELWTRDLGTGSFGHPVISAETVYVGFSSYQRGTLNQPSREEPVLLALDASTGAQRWSLRTRTVLDAPLMAENGLLYAVDEAPWSIDTPRDAMTIIAIDAATGTLVWDCSTDSTVVKGEPAMVDGVLYVSATYGDFRGLYAVDAASGDEIWRHRLGDGATTGPVVAGHLLIIASTLGNDARLDALGSGSEPKTLGWQLIAGFVAITGAGGLVDWLVRRAGGWRIQTLSSVRMSPWMWGAPILLALVISVLVSGTTGFLTAWLGLAIVALVEVLGRIPAARRRRFLAVLWLWALLMLALSIDLTNDRLGPIALFDHPERMLALILLAAAGGFALLTATGGFALPGWAWPVSTGIAWLAAAVAAALVITVHEGTTGYLDAWRMLLGERSRAGFMSPPTPEVLGSADLAVFALIGAGLMMAASLVAWAVGSAPLRRQLRQLSFWLLPTFAVAAATGVLTDAALGWWVWVMPIAGLVIGIMVHTRLALALTMAFGSAMTTGAAAGILLARGLVHAWEAPGCDWLSLCTPAQIGAGVIGIMLVSLLLSLAGLGLGRSLGRTDRSMRQHPV